MNKIVEHLINGVQYTPWRSALEVIEAATRAVDGDPKYAWLNDMLNRHNVQFDTYSDNFTFPADITKVADRVSVDDDEHTYSLDFEATNSLFLHSEVYRRWNDAGGSPCFNVPDPIRKFLKQGAESFLEELSSGKPLESFDPFDL